jgi:iron complex transport system ATP-binding protein
VSASLEPKIPRDIPVIDVVVAGASAATVPWWDVPEQAELRRADELLDLVACSDLRRQRFGLLSSGEKQRVLIARALMLSPALLLLDEPSAGLDLRAREQLAALQSQLNDGIGLLATVVVTHHVEEIASSTTHALVLRSGQVVAAGPLGETVTGPILTEAFGLPLNVQRIRGRFSARAAGF